MKISYAITVCNELVEIQRLLPFLIENKRKQDEIVIFYDSNNLLKHTPNLDLFIIILMGILLI
jgi:hypothetical protein